MVSSFWVHFLASSRRGVPAAAGVLLAGLCFGPAQAASSTANLTVSITVTASCSINAATLTFPSTASDVLAAGAVDGATTVSVTCTNQSPYAIGMGLGANANGTQRRVNNGSGVYLDYNLYTNAGRTNLWSTEVPASPTSCPTANTCFLGTGTGAAQSVDIYGRVPAASSIAGTFTDTVLMTIVY